MSARWTFSEVGVIGGDDRPGSRTRVFRLRWGEGEGGSSVWWYEDTRRACCCECSGPLVAMSSSCEHARALKRHMAKVEPAAKPTLGYAKNRDSHSKNGDLHAKNGHIYAGIQGVYADAGLAHAASATRPRRSGTRKLTLNAHSDSPLWDIPVDKPVRLYLVVPGPAKGEGVEGDLAKAAALEAGERLAGLMFKRHRGHHGNPNLADRIQVTAMLAVAFEHGAAWAQQRNARNVKEG